MEWWKVFQIAAWTFITPLGMLCGVIGFAAAYVWFRRAGSAGRVANFAVGLLLIAPLVLLAAVVGNPVEVANTSSASGAIWLTFFAAYFLTGAAALSISWFLGIIFAVIWPPIEHSIWPVVNWIATGKFERRNLR